MKINPMKIIPSIRKVVFLATALIFIVPVARAQDESVGPGAAPILPVRGYVIYNYGDTVPGKLTWALKYVENNPVEIKFTPEGGKKEVLHAGEIIGFGNQLSVWLGEDDAAVKMALPWEDYVSVLSYKKKEPVFMNRMITGRVTVYLNRSSIGISTTHIEERKRIDGIGFTFSPGEGLQIGPTYRIDYRLIEGWERYTSYYVVKDGGEMIKVDKGSYEQMQTQLFGDCPAIQPELDKNPDLLKFKNFMILAGIYNQMCQ
jgi:hypothetical protein